MPRSVEEILAHADELAAKFEAYTPDPADEIDPQAVLELRHAVSNRSAAEKQLIEAIRHSRERGLSWNAIGSLVGTSGEAVRQKYQKLLAQPA